MFLANDTQDEIEPAQWKQITVDGEGLALDVDEEVASNASTIQLFNVYHEDAHACACRLHGETELIAPPR